MFKYVNRYIQIVVVVVIFIMSVSTVCAENKEITSSFNGVTLTTDKNEVEGLVVIKGINNTENILKLWVKKEAGNTIGKWYDVKDKKEINEEISIVDGTGTYYIYAMIQLDGYEYIYGPSLIINNINEIKVSIKKEKQDVEQIDNKLDFLNNYEEEKSIAELSKELTELKTTDRQKIEAIYSWTVENITYDYEKYNHILMGDYSDKYGVEVTYETKKGVCYDFAKLFAVLCREAGIEAKTAKGYCTSVVGYHAWNEVYDSEQNEWLTLDISSDSIRYHKFGTNDILNIRSETDYYKTGEEL